MSKSFVIRDNVWLRKAKPQKSYLWLVQLPDLLTPNSNHSEVGARIVGATVPFNAFENNKIPFGNGYQYTTRSMEIGSLTLEFLEMEDGLTVDYILSWQNLMSPGVATPYNSTKPRSEQGQTRTFSAPTKYKRDIILYRIDENKKDTVQFIYSGCFPLRISDSNNSYDTNDVIKHTVTFSVDSFTHKVV